MDAPVRTFLDRIGFALTVPVLGTVGPGLAGSRGWLTGVSPLVIDGVNGAVAVTAEAVWAGSSVYPWQTSDQTLTVSSSDADDDDGDTGANTIRVWWLNAAGVETATDVTMDGVNAVVTAVSTLRRINRAEVLTCGTTGANEGTISLYATDGVTALGIIQPPSTAASTGGGSLNGCIQTVPAGHMDVIESMQVGTDGQAVTFHLMSRTSSAGPWLRMATIRFIAPFADAVNFDPIVFSAGTDYCVLCLGTNGAIGYAALTGWREPV